MASGTVGRSRFKALFLESFAAVTLKTALHIESFAAVAVLHMPFAVAVRAGNSCRMVNAMMKYDMLR